MAYESIINAENAWINGHRSRGYVEKYIQCTFIGTRSINWYGSQWEAKDRNGETLARGSLSSVRRVK